MTSIILEPFSLQTLDCALELFTLVDANRDYLKKRLPWLDDTKTMADSQKFIKVSLEKQENKQAFNFLIRNPQKILMGTIGLMNAHEQTASIGYWIGEYFQGQGYMSCACSELIEKAKQIPTIKELLIQCEPDNSASARIAQKCGFTYSHRLKNETSLYGKPIDFDNYTLDIKSL